ncbi:Kynurenine formamidase, partial [Armadillidium vulgare]
HSDGSHLVELDFELGPEVPIYPLPKFKHFIIEKTKEGYELNGNWIATQKITADEHTGTHIDAPLQFYEHGRDLDEIPLDKLFGPGAVIDITEKVKSNKHI